MLSMDSMGRFTWKRVNAESWNGIQTTVGSLVESGEVFNHLEYFPCSGAMWTILICAATQELAQMVLLSNGHVRLAKVDLLEIS